MSNVKLAVRVRPFADRELKSEKDCVPVVDVIDKNTVAITNVKVSVSGAGDSRERVRKYFVDYTFNSACDNTDPEYASQEKVFDTIGRDVLSSVTQGSATCVLAYGQSATGKTFTMMGNDDQPGLVPRLCTALAELEPVDITVSFLEIYNERVHDLLVETPVTCHSLPRRRGNSRKDLRVREHPSRGTYVQNLRRVAVQDLASLLTLVSEGTRRRHTAATRRNSTSSRSHALLEITTSTATLNLADLAGSEKASWEGSGGSRQKEGANINKSLVALSNVISALVSGGRRGRFVPYRDSALTWILKDCFTGGANTFIIATVSPSVACYGESASTLRWAAQARQLPAPRVANNCTGITKAALQRQLNLLIDELAKHHIRYIPDTGKISYNDDHWLLHTKEDVVERKIGNLINMFTPKAEINSESTTSSVASGSSEVINIIDKNIKEEVNKEVDKLFGPALERTVSGSEIQTNALLRHKKRQYKSQEVLPMTEIVQGDTALILSSLPSSQSQVKLNESESKEKLHVPIFYDNQRAEIVASVTERLYSKLKKKEENAVSKMESIVDRKIMEPLSELRICTNARQRLIDLSRKASRNKRRIGIPAHTQTRLTVTRVRDQGIDAQNDLGSYIIKKDNSCVVQRDVCTETIPYTPRCKEIAVGSKDGCLQFCDQSTLTEAKQIDRKNTFMMTDIIPIVNTSTQTPVPPPRRRRARKLNKCRCSESDDDTRCDCCEHSIPSPSICINICPQYPESGSQSSDDTTTTCSSNKESHNKSQKLLMTPDLLTNHSTVDTCSHDDNEDLAKESETSNGQSLLLKCCCDKASAPKTFSTNKMEINEEFPDTDDCTLPRVIGNSLGVLNKEEMKEMILGRNYDTYPYNIILSPPRERENSIKIVKFREKVASPPPLVNYCGCDTKVCGTEGLSSEEVCTEKSDVTNMESSVKSDSGDTSKTDTNSFIWKAPPPRDINSFKINTADKVKNRPYSAASKNKCNSRYISARTRIYKEFLGLDNKDDTTNIPDSNYSHPYTYGDSSSETETVSQDRFKSRKKFFEDKFKNSFEVQSNYERKILQACDSIDASIDSYESYLDKYYIAKGNVSGDHSIRTPKKYLQHLVQIRRDLVKADSDKNNSYNMIF